VQLPSPQPSPQFLALQQGATCVLAGPSTLARLIARCDVVVECPLLHHLQPQPSPTARAQASHHAPIRQRIRKPPLVEAIREAAVRQTLVAREAALVGEAALVAALAAVCIAPATPHRFFITSIPPTTTLYFHTPQCCSRWMQDVALVAGKVALVARMCATTSTLPPHTCRLSPPLA